MWLERRNLVASFKDFQSTIPYGLGPTTAPIPQPSKIPVLSSVPEPIYSSAEWISQLLADLCHPFQSLSLEQSPVSSISHHSSTSKLPNMLLTSSCIPTSSMLLSFWAMPNFVHCLFTITLGEYLRETRKKCGFNLPFLSKVQLIRSPSYSRRDISHLS